jgi:hypothetical protein
MALIVEDGSGKETANAYVDISYVSAYLLGEQFEAWAALSEPEQEAAIIRATRAVDALYDWKGTRKTLEQSLNWPRKGVEYECFEIIGVPAAVKKATAEVVGLFLDGAAFFSDEADREVISEKVDTIAVAYATRQPGGKKEATPFEALNRILRGLYRTETGSSGFGAAPVERV